MTRSVVDLVARVQKLLALSTSTNAHEAASARRRAQELIDRHRLHDLIAADGQDGAGAGDEGEDGGGCSDGRDEPLVVARRPRRFRRVLAAALADDNGGVVWSRVDDDGAEALCFCGRADDRAVVAALFSSLATTLEWLSASAAAGQPRSRRWHEAFRIGAVDVIIARAAAGDDDVDSALVVVDVARAARAARARAFAAARGLAVVDDGFLVDARGYAQGRRAAQTATLLPPRRR